MANIFHIKRADNEIILGTTNTLIEMTGHSTLTGINTLATGLSFQRIICLQTDATALTGTLRGAYIDVSNGALAATGTIRGMELKARTEAPGDTGNDVAVLEGLSISADSKAHSVTTMRAAEFILDGKTGGTINEAVGLRIANNLQADKATTSYGLQIYRDSFDYTADIQLSSGGLIGGSTGDLRITDGGLVGIGIVPTTKFTIGSTDNSDRIDIYHDNTNAFMQWSDGTLRLSSTETDIDTIIQIQGPGTGLGKLRCYGPDNVEWVELYSHGGYGLFEVTGASPLALIFNNNAHSDVWMFHGCAEGETKGLRVYGYKTGDSKRYLDITTGGTAADTVDFTGLSNYKFNGNIIIPDGATIGQNTGPLLTFDDTNNYFSITAMGINVGIGTSLVGSGGLNVLSLYSGASAPSSSPLDIIQLYASNLGVGDTACLFIRNETGTIVRLNQDVATLASPTFVNINVTGTYKVDDIQVISNRVIDVRCDDAINSGDATTDGVIDALRDAMITHGLIAAA